MSITSRLERVTETIGRAGGWFGVGACFAIMVLVTANVITRFLWESIPGTLEITQALLVVLVVMLLAYTQARRGHVNVEFVFNYLPKRVQRVLTIVTLFLALGFTILLAWQGWNLGLTALRVWDASGTYPNIPYYPAKIIFAIGVSMFCLQLIVDIWREIARLLPHARNKSDTASA